MPRRAESGGRGSHPEKSERAQSSAGEPRQLELSIEAEEHSDPAGAKRARAIVSSLDEMSSEEVFAAFDELDHLPPNTVRAALAAVTGPSPDPEQLDDTTRRAHGFPPRALRLATLAVVTDADVLDLGPVAEEQLRIAGQAWDGRDLAPEERLDGELEGSFAGTLEHRVLGDADAPSPTPMFDVLRYAGDAGAIFRAGTTKLLGAIAGTIVEVRDRRVRLAIDQALALDSEVEEQMPWAEPLEEPQEPEETKPAKKAAAKKPAAKKAAATKAEKAEKAPAKKAAAKKTTAKKTVAKAKATSKKTSAKKAKAESEE